jgi:hypothetical protein
MTMRDMTKAELEAVEGMTSGRLGPLADLLASEAADIHPLIQRTIWKLIRGSADQSDYRLELCRHPDLRDLRKGNVAEGRKEAEQVRLARSLSRLGEYEHLRNGHNEEDDWYWPNGFDSAVESLVQPGSKRTKITDSWTAQRAFIAFGIRSGYVKDDN